AEDPRDGHRDRDERAPRRRGDGAAAGDGAPVPWGDAGRDRGSGVSRAPDERRKGNNGEKGPDREVAAEAEVPGASPQSVHAMRAAPGVSEEVRDLPHLLPRDVAAGRDPWGSEGELVAAGPVPIVRRRGGAFGAGCRTLPTSPTSGRIL